MSVKSIKKRTCTLLESPLVLVWQNRGCHRTLPTEFNKRVDTPKFNPHNEERPSGRLPLITTFQEESLQFPGLNPNQNAEKGGANSPSVHSSRRLAASRPAASC